jgi:hypothetical protein
MSYIFFLYLYLPLLFFKNKKITKKNPIFPFKALELQPGDKNCLVCRSKCHLQLGDTATALEDAELSLADDNTFHKVIIIILY